MRIYLVGGAVRDQLLGLPIQERDWVVVGASIEDMIQQGFRPVGKDFPVFLHPKTNEEYALARTERKTGRGYSEFTFYTSPDVTLEQDLGRRDLTINAMAELPDGTIVDPFNGQKDLADKKLRHVSVAFIEDPVRLLRIARFAARYAKLDFSIANETMALLKKMVANGEVDALVKDRVWQETQRALNGSSPEVFFKILRECGALQKLFPEIDNLFGIPNPPQWHPEIDSGIHALLSLQIASEISTEAVVRFAALLHDVGKALTPRSKWPKHIGHEQAGVKVVEALCARYPVPKTFRELAILVSKYHLHAHRAAELKPSTLVKLLEKIDAYRRPDRFSQFLLACEADARGRTGMEQIEYAPKNFLKKIYLITRDVPIEPLLERELTGQKLAQALHEARVNAIKSEGI